MVGEVGVRWCALGLAVLGVVRPCLNYKVIFGYLLRNSTKYTPNGSAWRPAPVRLTAGHIQHDEAQREGVKEL